MLADDLKRIAGLGVQRNGRAAVHHRQAQVARTVYQGDQVAFFGVAVAVDKAGDGVVIQFDMEGGEGQQVIGADVGCHVAEVVDVNDLAAPALIQRVGLGDVEAVDIFDV